MEYIYKVSDLAGKVKRYLEGNYEFKNIIVEGELSGVTYYKSGHLYFQLKDENSQVKCAAFSYQRRGIPNDLQEGEKVRIFADVGFYENRGEFQLLVKGIEKQNSLGILYAELEALKKRMAEEGYFSLEHKRALQKYPKAIGVVTAITGAAIHDIVKTIRKRDPRITIYIYSAKVQGIGAEREIVAGIETLNQIPEIDFIIAGRGGGSIEDLWAFNKEEVAMAFYHSQKPIISAVGHEVDILLSDFTADVRAATPTQAVELSVPELNYYEKEIQSRYDRLQFMEKQYLLKRKQDLQKRMQEYVLQHFPKSIENYKRELLHREEQLQKSMEAFLERKRQKYHLSLESVIHLNPMKVLQKGYAVLKKGGQRLRSLEEVRIHEEIEIQMMDGKITAEVKEKQYANAME